MDRQRIYIAIDLKSFYASVECAGRGLDPMTTHLVVADESRTEKTICLAVSPSLKAYGIPGRARLFEVNQRIAQINAQRLAAAPDGAFCGSSSQAPELAAHPEYRLDFIIARPRMARYMEISTQIYGIYCQFVAPEDIHVYSIDEVFMDVTPYLDTYRCTPHELAMRMIRRVLKETGITATAGIGTNLYLAKVAMDIMAKHIKPDQDGVRIAFLDEMTYRQALWGHRPITDFWRVGKGYARRLAQMGLYTMGDVARASLGPPYSPIGENKLYSLFGVNAELLIDHAWGAENCTIRDIKAYVPRDHSISTGQVLTGPTPAAQARLIVQEMADVMALQLLEKRVTTDQIFLYVGYDRESLEDPARRAAYDGPLEKDWYGRMVPKAVHGSESLPCAASSARLITKAMLTVFDRIVHPHLLVRRIFVGAGRLMAETGETPPPMPEQLDMFTDYAALDARRQVMRAELEKEKSRQLAVLTIKQRFGKNAILRGMNYLEGATARERNAQIGGHRA